MRNWQRYALIATILWAAMVTVAVLWQINGASPQAHGALVYYDAHEYVDPGAALMGASAAAGRQVLTVLEVDSLRGLAMLVLPLAALWAVLGWRARGAPGAGDNRSP